MPFQIDIHCSTQVLREEALAAISLVRAEVDGRPSLTEMQQLCTVVTELKAEAANRKRKLEHARTELHLRKTELEQLRTDMVEEHIARDELEFAVRNALSLATAGVTTSLARVTMESLAKSMRSAARSPSSAAVDGSHSIHLDDQSIRRVDRPRRVVRERRSRVREYAEAAMVYRGHTDWVIHLMPTADGTKVISAGQDHTARVFDVASGECLKVLTGHTEAIRAICLSLPEHSVYTASLDGTMREWSITAGEELFRTRCHSPSQGILAMCLVGRVGFVTASRDETAVLWHWRHGERPLAEGESPTGYGKHVVRGVTFRGHSNWVTAAVTEGKWLFTGSSDTSVKRWELATGMLLETYRGHQSEVTALEIYEHCVYSAGREGAILKRDVGSGEVLQWFSGHLSVVRDIVCRDGTLFSASADGTARCWDIETGACSVTLSGHGCAVCAIGATEKTIYTGASDGAVRKFEADPDTAGQGWHGMVVAQRGTRH